MRCIITAGPTYEPLDEVRRMTNFSTGRLGCDLAAFLTARGHEVTLLVGEQATYTGPRQAKVVNSFSTTESLAERLVEAARLPIDAVFHAAAVSDYQFGKTWLRRPDGGLVELKSRKISTREGTLLAELLPTRKLIAQLRLWFPQAVLVGWKYEVEGDRAAALRLGKRQLVECRTDACVVNGPAYGAGFGLAMLGQEPMHLRDRPLLFEALVRLVRPRTP